MSADLLALWKDAGALLDGHFLLSSGLHSPRYLQCARVLMDPPTATRLGTELGAALAAAVAPRRATAVVSPALGGVIVGHEVARALGVPALFTERQDGRMLLRRGFSLGPDDAVVVVEDVITTGKSTREVLDVVKAAGASVIAVGSLVDRSGGSGVDFGVPRRSLFALDVPAWEPASCPLCRDGSLPEKPGSRSAAAATSA